MTKAEQFWQNAKEALQWASQSEDKYEMQGLIELAGTWARAAAARQLMSDPSFISSPQAGDEMRSFARSSAA
jgi:hypothetical protein